MATPWEPAAVLRLRELSRLIQISGGGNRYWNGEKISAGTIRSGGTAGDRSTGDPVRGWGTIGCWQIVRLSPRVSRETSFSVGTLTSVPASGPKAGNRPAQSVVTSRVKARMERAGCFIKVEQQ